MCPQVIAIRALAASVAAATLLALAPPAAAKGSPLRACTAAYSGAQEQARSGHLREAKELYLRCAKTTCGGLQWKCVSAADRAASDLAQVSLAVSDSTGTPLVDVLVKMDGEPVATHLDGRALTIEPGVHEFTFGARVGDPGRYVWMTRKLTVAQGQRDPIAVALPPPSGVEIESPAPSSPSPSSPSEPEPAVIAAPMTLEPAPEAPRRRSSVIPWVVGGVGVLGVGAGALLTYWGRTDNDALAQCAPDCRASSVAHIQQLYLAADISFAAGGAAVGLAAILLATSHPRERPASGSAPRSRSAYSFGVQPTGSGAFASFEGAF